MATEDGLEPPYSESKSAVLPLDYSVIFGGVYGKSNPYLNLDRIACKPLH